MANYLSQLKAVTVVVADTGDFASIQKFLPRDATTNPSLIAAAAAMPQYQPVVEQALRWAKTHSKDQTPAGLTKRAVDRLAVEFGIRILEVVPGRVSTEVDARLSHDTAASIEKARDLIGMYEAAGIKRDRVLVKLASTWEGIKAAEVLEREGIHCNLTLLFGFHQAVACAEAKVTLISPFVGRILDWYLKSTGKTAYAPPEDPGVLSVTRVYNYYKRHGYQTEVMGASLPQRGRNHRAGRLRPAHHRPQAARRARGLQGPLPRKLDPAKAGALGEAKVSLDKAGFEAAHAADRMANDKLKEGIDGFSKAITELEKSLEPRLAGL